MDWLGPMYSVRRGEISHHCVADRKVFFQSCRCRNQVSTNPGPVQHTVYTKKVFFKNYWLPSRKPSRLGSLAANSVCRFNRVGARLPIQMAWHATER
jgi:hypothetical protein